MKRVVALAEAAEDIEAARDFYDALDTNVGDYCADSLLTDFESLDLFGGIHPLRFGFHRMLASRFPFGIYYREHGRDAGCCCAGFAMKSELDSQGIGEAVRMRCATN